ncbi:hypothetical protein HMPREF6123_0063, partial [Oribacterium sinus F0268]
METTAPYFCSSNFTSPGKKWFSKPLLAYFKLYPLKKYSIDNFMIYSYIAFENL